jgi:7-cyano-7-deazaguanine synthase in queuosine biosynthesis
LTGKKAKVASSLVHCVAHGVRRNIPPQVIRFRSGIDLIATVAGQLGPHGISPVAADLIDVAAAVFQIERQLTGRQRTNPVNHFEVTFSVREPSLWKRDVIEIVAETLAVLGYPSWSIHMERGSAPIPAHEVVERRRNIKQVALFSGGLDSTCGALLLHRRRNATMLTSYYTGQKSLQIQLAHDIGFDAPVQWSLRWNKAAGRGHSYFYRSFLFLAFGAVVAESWGAKRILQFENGILASAVPPAASFAMTHHAHPRLHACCSRLFSLLFGGKWTVENPFSGYTKHRCVQEAIRVKNSNVRKILGSTQTCWFYRSNRIPGALKEPNIACGICIPCVVRRTAVPDETYAYDLHRDKIKNDRILGLAFRSYYGFLSRICECDNERQFYAQLPAAGRELIGTGAISLHDLYGLFHQFATEFMKVYRVAPR